LIIIRSFAVTLFFVFFLSFQINAADNIADSQPQSESQGEVIENPDYNSSNKSKIKFIAHKKNYLLMFSKSDYDDDRKSYEAKYQISVKVQILTMWDWAWYLAYSQKSFWQIYDDENSRPFRESNYNPETFIRSDMWGGFRFDLGLEHESNGARVETSRSWNRIYIYPYYENKYLITGLKAWYRIKDDPKESPDDISGDDNPDIHKYYGYGELYLTVKIRDFRLGTQLRYNTVHKKGSMRYDATYPVFSNSMYWYVQYWQGYGESLIDYNVNQKSLALGFMFTL
jgi:phospholipase A1